MTGRWTTFAAPLLTLALLAGIVADAAANHQVPTDAAAYHARVRGAAAAIPSRFGNWIGVDAPLASSAVAMLRPNVVVSRVYHEVRGPGQFSFLLVQCTDARDILGHYPPVCYPGAGWLLEQAKGCQWVVGGAAVPGMVYQFTRRVGQSQQEMVVHNFMVLPDGQLCPDMAGVSRVSQDYRKRFYGVAQVQLVFPPAMSAKERDVVTRRVVEDCSQVLQAIRTGVAP